MRSGGGEWSGAALLREARLGAGLTQSQLAARAGVPRTMVSAYERDLRQPTLPTLVRLLRAAGFELQVELVPVSAQDDVLRQMEHEFSATQQDEQHESEQRATRERRRQRAAEQTKRRQAGNG